MNKKQDLQTLLCDVHQLLTEWHQDGTAWTEWDEQVRNRVLSMMGNISDLMKEHKNVKTIVFNIKEGVDKEPTMLASSPDAGVVKEFYDRYEWDVIHERGSHVFMINARPVMELE